MKQRENEATEHGMLVAWNDKLVEPEDYGVVRIVSGQFKGYLGYYDTDEDADGKTCLVYPFGFAPKAAYGIRRSALRMATPEEEGAWWDTSVPKDYPVALIQNMRWKRLRSDPGFDGVPPGVPTLVDGIESKKT